MSPGPFVGDPTLRFITSWAGWVPRAVRPCEHGRALKQRRTLSR